MLSSNNIRVFKLIILIILAIKIDISEDDEILFIIKTNNTIDIILLKLNKMLFLELMMFIIITITDIMLNMVIGVSFKNINKL